MSKPRSTCIAGGLAALLLLAASSTALAQSEQQTLVNAADQTLSHFMSDPDMTWLQENFSRAKAIMIAPEVAKAGFIFGGSGGLSLDGTVIAISNEWNDAYYAKKGILPPDILIRMSAHNKAADKLLADVHRDAGKK